MLLGTNCSLTKAASASPLREPRLRGGHMSGFPRGEAVPFGFYAKNWYIDDLCMMTYHIELVIYDIFNI